MIAPDLVRRLKRLRLGGLLPTLPDRATAAQQSQLSPLEFLELCLQDEIDRRDSHGVATRVAAAGFEEVVSLEQVTWETPVAFDRPRVRELFTLAWLREHENVIFCGPVGVGENVLGVRPGPERLPGRRPRPVREGRAPPPESPPVPGGQLLRAGAPELGGAGSRHPRRLRAPEAHRPTVERLLRRLGRAPHPRLDHPHQQPRRGRVGRPVRRPYLGEQRPGPLRPPRPPDRHGGAESPGGQSPEPAEGQAADQRIGRFTGIVRYGSLRHRRTWRRSGPRGPACPLQKGLAQATLMP